MTEDYYLASLQPELVPYVKYALDYFQQATGVRPTITSATRSVEKQAELYRNRASNPYPVNRPGDSAHNYGLAFDSSFNADEKARWMAAWVQVRQAMGFRVPDNDPVHAEVPGWRDLLGSR